MMASICLLSPSASDESFNDTNDRQPPRAADARHVQPSEGVRQGCFRSTLGQPMNVRRTYDAFQRRPSEMVLRPGTDSPAAPVPRHESYRRDDMGSIRTGCIEECQAGFLSSAHGGVVEGWLGCAVFRVKTSANMDLHQGPFQAPWGYHRRLRTYIQRLHTARDPHGVERALEAFFQPDDGSAAARRLATTTKYISTIPIIMQRH
jgi:hypothetical protein